MAEKNTQHCALCGKELGALSVTTIRCGLINQMVCSSCEKRYTGAVLEEKVRLLEEMERTGYLTRPEEFRSFLEQFRARVEKLRNTCTCCGQPMQYRTIMRMEYGSLDWLAGEYRAIDVAVFCCGVCGQVRMYDAFYLNGISDPVLSITPPQARDNGAPLRTPPAPEPPEEPERCEPEKEEPRGWFGRRKKDRPEWEK